MNKEFPAPQELRCIDKEERSRKWFVFGTAVTKEEALAQTKIKQTHQEIYSLHFDAEMASYEDYRCDSSGAARSCSESSLFLSPHALGPMRKTAEYAV